MVSGFFIVRNVHTPKIKRVNQQVEILKHPILVSGLVPGKGGLLKPLVIKVLAPGRNSPTARILIK